MKRIVILGAGGHGQVVADILLAMAEASSSFSVVGFLDDDPSNWGKQFLGLTVLGPLKSISDIPHEGVVAAIGNNKARSQVVSSLHEQGEHLISATHPRAVLGTGVRIGPGSMICAGVVVNTGAEIGEGVILNTGSTVDHHCRIGRCSHIGPGAHLGGDVVIGEGVLVGIGAAVLPSRRIGSWSVVGAGATVTEDIPDGWTVVGKPARRVAKEA